MQMTIITVGKASDPAVASLVDTYQKRLTQWTTLKWHVISNGKDSDDETKAILRSLKSTDYVILLDERGTLQTTDAMTEMFDQWLHTGRHLVFVIGGAYGVSQALHDRADFVWSFSKLVFPHQLMRVLLVEQLYRICNHRAGGKYHHH